MQDMDRLPPRLSKRAGFLGAAVLLAGFALAYLSIVYQEREQTFEGTWLWQFEGSQFYEAPPGTDPCLLLARRGSWLGYGPEQIYGSYNYRRSYPSSGTHISQYGQYRLEAFAVKFTGKRHNSLFGVGHLGGWHSEYEVTRMISAKPIPGLVCNVHYPE